MLSSPPLFIVDMIIWRVDRSEDQIKFLHSLLGQSTAIEVMEVLEKAAPDRVFSRHRIQEAEEQIEIINQNLQEIVKKTEEKQVEIVLTRSTLNSLKSQDSTLRYQVVRRNEALDPLHLALDKLSFANSAYRDKSITNSCSPEEDIDYRRLKSRMMHGNNNLHKERQVLREMKTKEGSCSSLEDIHSEIRRLHYRMIYYMSRKDEEENIKRQIKLLESEKERVIINCVVGGKLWRSFGSRKDIQNRINIAFDQNEVDNSVLPTAIDHLVVNGYVSIDDGNFSNFLDGLLWACRPKFIRLHCLNSSEILLEEFSSWYLLAKNSGKGDKEHCHRLKDAKIATEEEMKEEFRSFSKDMITLLNWGVWLRLTWY
ncbi:hypothetical protein LINPERPRIM_LOCUS3366 [Linum perenne]